MGWFSKKENWLNMLDKYSLVEYDSSPPDLAEIKQRTYEIKRRSERLNDHVIAQSIGAIKDIIWDYSDKDFQFETFHLNTPAENFMLIEDYWWRNRDDRLLGNTKYLNNVWHKQGLMQGFYAIGATLSEHNSDQNYAIEVFKIAIRIESTYFQCHMRIGDCYLKNEEYDNGIPYYKTSLDINSKLGEDEQLGPGDYRAWCYLGVGICLLHISEREKGIYFIKLAKSVAVESFTAYLLYGYQSWNSLYDHFSIDAN